VLIGRATAGEALSFRSKTFPSIFPLGILYPTVAATGKRVFAPTGIDEFDASGTSVSTAGDPNGDGIDDIMIGACNATPGVRRPRRSCTRCESYAVFGRIQNFPPVLSLARLYPVRRRCSVGFVLTGIHSQDSMGYSAVAETPTATGRRRGHRRVSADRGYLPGGRELRDIRSASGPP
jgi:hypothetical protein